jgi:hypothetical protein
MVMRLCALALLLGVLPALPALAAESKPKAELYEVVITTYSRGIVQAESTLRCHPDNMISTSIGTSSPDQAKTQLYCAFHFGDHPQVSPSVTSDLARYQGRLQHVSFSGADFQFYTAAVVDYIEIQLRVCSVSDIAPYRAIMEMSPEVDRDIYSRLLKPAGRIKVATTHFPASAAPGEPAGSVPPATAEQ